MVGDDMEWLVLRIPENLQCFLVAHQHSSMVQLERIPEAFLASLTEVQELIVNTTFSLE